MTVHIPTVIRLVTPNDVAGVAQIYNYYIEHTIVTFEDQIITEAEMARRIGDVQATTWPWLVAAQHDEVLGYAYANPWKARSGYRFSVEISAYLHVEQTGRGLGSLLYKELFALLIGRGVHAIMAGIALPNAGSVALHEKFGMQQVAYFREVGFKFEQWIDVGYWQRLL